MNEITIRKYKESDSNELAKIYYNTIHNINTGDYNEEQVNAWAPISSLKTDGWSRKWQKLVPWVAILNAQIVGFAEFDDNGHIDCFYCHHEFQGKGVGKALMNFC